MSTKFIDKTIVHGWCGWVEKSNDFTCKMMVLNKLWIPDVLIDIIKDYLYISAEEVLRKYYKLSINYSISRMVVDVRYYSDMYGRPRIANWQTGHIYAPNEVQLRADVCLTCGDFSLQHPNVNGCCDLEWDEQPLELIDPTSLYDAIEWMNEEPDENSEVLDEAIPEVDWNNIPDMPDDIPDDIPEDDYPSPYLSDDDPRWDSDSESDSYDRNDPGEFDNQFFTRLAKRSRARSTSNV